MRKLLTFVALMLALSLAVAACTPEEEAAVVEELTSEEEPAEEEPMEEEVMEDETVTIFTAAGEEQMAVLQSAFDGFTADTGIEVVVEGSPDFEQLVNVRCEAGDAPDILNFPQPGLMADLARSGCLADLSFMDMGLLEENYSDAWIESGKVDGDLYGLWHTVDVKSLVWYPKGDFEDMGFAIPETWDELIALSDALVARGVTPWCVGIESGGATGWVATDWVEDIMLRTTSPENYDKWTTGELPFSSPEVKNAFETAGEIFFNPDYVVGGTTGILTTSFGDSPLGLFDPRVCYLHRQASFIPSFFPEGTEVGVDVDYFYLPGIDAQYGNPVLGSGNLMSMGQDRPAVRSVMEFLATAASVEPEVKSGNALAPHSTVPLDWYPSTAQQGFAQILANADTFRFDGSDLMPGAVGAGSFWTGATDWIGGADLDEVLADIDATWPQ